MARMPSNKAPCRLTLRVGTISRIGRPLASIPEIRTCSFASRRGSRRFPNIVSLLLTEGIVAQSPSVVQDCGCGAAEPRMEGRIEELRSRAGLALGSGNSSRVIQIDACTHSNIASLCPSLELLPDAVIYAPALRFGRFFPTLGSHAVWSDRCARGAQFDLAPPLPDA